MTKNTRSLAAASILLAVTAAAWAQQFSLRAGEYETTVEMALPGEPAPMSFTALSCITPEEAKDVQKALVKTLAEHGECEISNVRNSARRLDFDMACVEDGQRTAIKVETTLSGADTYEQVATTTLGRDVITMKTKAKWRSANCSPESMED